MNIISEEQFETEICDKLKANGYSVIENNFRENYKEVINYEVLSKSLIKINKINDDQLNKTLLEINKIYENDLLMTNKNAHELLIEGIKIYDEILKITKTIKLISNNVNDNTYQYIRQLKVLDGKYIRIPDITIYLNGLPVGVLELKSPKINNPEILEEAYLQNESLKRKIPQLWIFNIINFVSNRFETKYGCIYSHFNKMAKVKDLYTRDKIHIIDLLFGFKNILDFIKIYSYFSFENNVWIKYIALPHQIMAVKNTIKTLKMSKNNKGGVVWHTQGSGKSVTMLFLTKTILQEFKKSTLIFVTDRQDLENQLYQRFLQAELYLRNKVIKIDSRNDLIEKLNNKLHFGIYFAMVQKWNENTSLLSNRDDIILIADEAHRTQNNLNGDIFINKNKKQVNVKYGYAKYMRDAFPNAKLIGFTGTPLMNETKYTTEIFGDYNHRYLMNDSVDDGSTVPIYYEMRRIDLDLDKKILNQLDDIQNKYINSLCFDDINNNEKLNKLNESVRTKAILENPVVIKAKAKDLIRHMEKNKSIVNGKAMLVASSRHAAFEYFNIIKEINEDLFKKTILVMTSNNKDSKEMVDVIIPKDRLLEVANEFRKPNSDYKLAIVVDMWLTGYDVPDLSVLYVDKLMQWHNLMQAIARVNRTYIDKQKSFKNKENGLIIDYIGIWKKLANAMIRYSGYESGELDINLEDIENAYNNLLELINILDKENLHGITRYFTLEPEQKYNFLLDKYNCVKLMQQDDINIFIINAKKIKKLYKISFSKLSEEEIINVKGILSILTLVINKSIYFDNNLFDVIQNIKELSKQSVIIDESEIKIENTKITKNIYELAEVLAEEANKLIKTKPYIAIELMEASIRAKILEIEKIRPFFAKKISEKLKEILEELKLTGDLEKIIEVLRIIAKEIQEKEKEELQFDEAPLQAFYEIVADDNFLKYHNNSEVLRKIAKDVLKTIRKEGIDQIENNPKIKSNIKMALRKLLKKVYGYPPESSKKMSGLLINELEKYIHINYDYFKGENING